MTPFCGDLWEVFRKFWDIYLGDPRWWFQIFFMFIPTWGRFPFWLIFFKWVGSTTNQYTNDGCWIDVCSTRQQELVSWYKKGVQNPCLEVNDNKLMARRCDFYVRALFACHVLGLRKLTGKQVVLRCFPSKTCWRFSVRSYFATWFLL